MNIDTRLATRILAAALLAIAPSAGAATFTVDSTADAVDAAPGDGTCATAAAACTLRAAIQESNALPDADTIALPAGTYTMTIGGPDEDAAATGDFDLRMPITITGAGAASTIIDAAGLDRVFDVWTSAAIAGITITGGSAPGSFGGGIFSAPEESTLELFVDGVHFTGNQADNGGAILNDLGSNLTITNSSLSGNTAAIAGGALNNRNDVAVLTNVTISGNTAGSGDGIRNDLTTTLEHVTLAGDRIVGGDVTLRACVMNNGPGGTSCSGTTSVVSGGANVESGDTCGLGGGPAGADFVDTVPQLAPLADNGGGTLTHALTAGSPAIDLVTGTCNVSSDQRGVARPLDGDGDTIARCDAGAYEFDPGAVTTTTVVTTTTTTTTTLPGTCSPALTFTDLGCRVTLLGEQLAAAGTPGKPLDGLLAKVSKTTERLGTAETAAGEGKVRTAKKQVKKGAKLVKKVGKKLASAKKGPKIVADEPTRTELATGAEALSLDLRAFGDTF